METKLVKPGGLISTNEIRRPVSLIRHSTGAEIEKPTRELV